MLCVYSSRKDREEEEKGKEEGIGNKSERGGKEWLSGESNPFILFLSTPLFFQNGGNINRVMGSAVGAKKHTLWPKCLSLESDACMIVSLRSIVWAHLISVPEWKKGSYHGIERMRSYYHKKVWMEMEYLLWPKQSNACGTTSNRESTRGSLNFSSQRSSHRSLNPYSCNFLLDGVAACLFVALST